MDNDCLIEPVVCSLDVLDIRHADTLVPFFVVVSIILALCDAGTWRCSGAMCTLWGYIRILAFLSCYDRRYNRGEMLLQRRHSEKSCSLLPFLVARDECPTPTKPSCLMESRTTRHSSIDVRDRDALQAHRAPLAGGEW